MQYWITWLKTKPSPRSLPTGSWPGSTQDFLLITQSVLLQTIRKAARQAFRENRGGVQQTTAYFNNSICYKM